MSKSPSSRVAEEGTIRELYEDLASAYGELANTIRNDTGQAIPASVVDEVISLCKRIEDLLNLLQDEETNPQLSAADLVAGRNVLMEEVSALIQQAARLKTQIRSITR